jgi:hypothetical protein
LGTFVNLVLLFLRLLRLLAANVLGVWKKYIYQTWLVLSAAGFVVRSLQMPAHMCLVRASPAVKIPAPSLVYLFLRNALKSKLFQNPANPANPVEKAVCPVVSAEQQQLTTKLGGAGGLQLPDRQRNDALTSSPVVSSGSLLTP